MARSSGKRRNKDASPTNESLNNSTNESLNNPANTSHNLSNRFRNLRRPTIEVSDVEDSIRAVPHRPLWLTERNSDQHTRGASHQACPSPASSSVCPAEGGLTRTRMTDANDIQSDRASTTSETITSETITSGTRNPTSTSLLGTAEDRRVKLSSPSRDTCAICLIDISGNQTIGRLSICPHVFCFDCLFKWSKLSNRCPLCKTRFHAIQRRVFNIKDENAFDEIRVEDKELTEETDALTFDCICEICESGEQEQVLLLCDGCDGGFHTFCLNLDEVPEGSWFCPNCDPAQQISDHGIGRQMMTDVIEYWTRQNQPRRLIGRITRRRSEGLGHQEEPGFVIEGFALMEDDEMSGVTAEQDGNPTQHPFGASSPRTSRRRRRLDSHDSERPRRWRRLRRGIDEPDEPHCLPDVSHSSPDAEQQSADSSHESTRDAKQRNGEEREQSGRRISRNGRTDTRQSARRQL